MVAAWRVVIGVLATIGAITIVAGIGLGSLAAFMRILIGPDNSDRYVATTQSPDGKYKAILFTTTGGGAISPVCYDDIFVVPSIISEDAARSDLRNQIYSADCDSFVAEAGFIQRAPKIEWLSNDTVQVTFSINASALFARSVKLRKMDATGTVRAQFLAHE